MPKKSEQPPKPRPVGRPRTNPPGARVRAIRCTDAEWAALVALRDRLRGSRADQPADQPAVET